MEIKEVSSTFYWIKTKDCNGTLRTDVFKVGSLFKAFSVYVKDKNEERVGYGESVDKKVAVKLSRENLLTLTIR